MHIAFRVDSSTIIGYGHVMRCLTLARALTQQLKTSQNTKNNRNNNTTKHDDLLVSFICRNQHGHANQRIIDAGFKLLTLPKVEQVIDGQQTDSWLGTTYQQDSQQCITQLKMLPAITLLVVDHYAIDHQWHTLMKPYYNKLLVIDDLANRTLNCDYLLDQTYQRSTTAYQDLVPGHCQIFVGQDYILLRDEFTLLTAQAKQRRQERIEQGSHALTPSNIIITMGGTDPDNLSQLALYAIESLRQQAAQLTANIVISSQSQHLDSLTHFCEKRPWTRLMINSNNMAKLMLSADIAIGASGGTAWERCALGLPCLTTINAENQTLIATNLAQAGASINLGWYQGISTDDIACAINDLLKHMTTYEKMTNACFTICDGKGANRVAKKIIKNLIHTTDNITFHLAKKEDCQLIYRWQSNKNIRKYFINPSTPSWREHVQWYDSCLLDPKRKLYLLHDNKGNNVGLLRLDKLTNHECYVEDNTRATPAYEISIIIAPEYQGKGMAVKALKTLKSLKRDATYIATIHAENTQSRKTFINAGFQGTPKSSYQLKVINFQVVSINSKK